MMSKESKILLLKNKNDYVKKITNDEITNVTGSVGSGKSTYGIKYHNNKDYIVVGFDSLSKDNDPDTLNGDILELRKVLLKKYGNITENETFYYDDIVSFIKNKHKKGIIEGGCLAYMDIKRFKGIVIVKRTARLKCYLRSAWRDFKNPAWRKELSKFGLIKRFFHCYKRRFHHIFPQKYVEEFIENLETYKSN